MTPTAKTAAGVRAPSPGRARTARAATASGSHWAAGSSATVATAPTTAPPAPPGAAAQSLESRSHCPPACAGQGRRCRRTAAEPLPLGPAYPQAPRVVVAEVLEAFRRAVGRWRRVV